MPKEEVLWGMNGEDTYSIGVMADYLADADVANVGNGNFWQTSLNIVAEFGMLTQDQFVGFLDQQLVILDNFAFYSLVASETNPLVDTNSRRLQDYLSRGNISMESYIQEFLR